MRNEEPERINRKDPALSAKKNPVHIRRNVEDFNDPYIDCTHLEDHTTCKRCGFTYLAGRWCSNVKLPGTARKIAGRQPPTTVCPACRKSQDRLPGGVLKLTGGFIWQHEDEIINLIEHEASKAIEVNAIERVMSLESSDGEMQITTTNEKLAQRIGKALHKAYDGTIEYKWSEDTKLARVNWHRDS